MTQWQPPTIPAPPAPQPERKSWFARHKMLTALLAFALFVVVAQAAGGNSGASVDSGSAAEAPPAAAPVAVAPRTDASESATPAKAKPNEEPQPAGVGDAVRDGQFEFTVTKVRPGVKTVGNQYFGEKAQGQFVLVDVTVRNIGDSPQLLSDSSQRLKDAQGREFSADTSAGIHIADNDVFFTEINPGNTVRGTLVFDMPTGVAAASIDLHDSPFSGGATVRLG